MPHTEHLGPAAQAEAEEWTVVKPKGRSNRRFRRPPAHKDPAHDNSRLTNTTRRSSHESSSSSSSSSSNRSVADIVAEYTRIRETWLASPCCAALRRIAASAAAAAAAAATVSRAVCLGIGTFDPPDGSWDAKRRTFLQLVAFLVMVEELEKRSEGKIRCTFQEPAFSASDRAFISSLGHAVVDSPAAFALTGPDALLFGVHLYRPVYAQALRDAAPAIFVGTGWDVWDGLCIATNNNNDNDEDNENDIATLRAMHATHTLVPFPQDPSTTAFSSTSIYYRTTPAPSTERPPAAAAKDDASDEADGPTTGN